MTALLALAAVAMAAGCSLAPSNDVIRELVASDRSWCVSVTSVYGTVRMAGTGLASGRVSCTQEGLTVTATPPDG